MGVILHYPSSSSPSSAASTQWLHKCRRRHTWQRTRCTYVEAEDVNGGWPSLTETGVHDGSRTESEVDNRLWERAIVKTPDELECLIKAEMYRFPLRSTSSSSE